MIRVLFQGFCEVQNGCDYLFRHENDDHRLGPYSAFADLVLWKSFLQVTCFFGWTYAYFSIPLSLNPISNWKVVYPGKMFLDDSFPAFSHNQSGSALIRVGRSLRKVGGRSETTTTNKSGSGQGHYHPVITGWPVPLSGLPRLGTVRPHRRSDGIGLNILDNLPSP
jgi:hypothetical protein